MHARKMGWTAVCVWEHELSKPERVAAKVVRVMGAARAGIHTGVARTGIL